MADDADEAAALAELLAANGHGARDAAACCGSITQLEMFLQDYPKMLALHRFPQLRELRLIDQRIARIEGLSGCQRLQRLWLTENRIAEVAGLQACTALQELYLTSNRITTVQGLEALTGLKVLWLADNYISSITGLESLGQLQQLHLARNDVAHIGAGLGSCTALTSLDLAHNHISSLQDATTSLSRLTRLQDLCLADPLWGACPVASLCNYQTFVLAALPQLASLDTLLLAHETKAAAAATFAKKQLYYSMRTRTLQRAAGDLRRLAVATLQAQVAWWDRLHARLAYAAGCIQGQQQPDSRGATAATDGSQQAQQDLATLARLVAGVAEQQDGLRQRFDADCAQSAAGLSEASARLQLELGSAGNIWLEQGRPGDSWLQGCLELLGTLLAGAKAGHAAAGGIKVLSAARIHNRHLRTQFAQHAGSSAASLMHLCYAEQRPGELMHVAQHGFGSGCGSPGSSGGAAIQLASSISLAVPPSSECQGSAGSSPASNARSHGRHHHQVLVCKAALGGIIKSAGSLDSTGSIAPQQLPGVAAVHQGASSSSSSGQARRTAVNAQQQQRRRLWHVVDATAVLPELLVTFEYSSSSSSSSNSSCGSSRGPVVEFDVGAPLPAAACAAGSLSLCAQPLQPWLDAAAEWQQQGATSSSSLGRAMGASAAELAQQCEAVLTTLRRLACRRLPALNITMLQSVTGSQQLSAVASLSLQDCGLQRFDGLLSNLPTLASLALSFNRLTSLQGLAPAGASCCRLTLLDVSHNALSSWETQWLAGCNGSLVVLHAAHNKLARPEDLQQLRHLSRLQELSLASNPVQQHRAYQLALASLPQLRQLDGRPHVCAGSSSLLTSLDPGALRAGATLWHSDGAGPVPVLHTLGGSPDWRLLLHSVVLDGRHVAGLEGLADAAPNLVSASFQGNLLSDLSGLAGCLQLQSLCLADNLVTHLTPLSGLTRLEQLDVSHNQISSLAPVSAFARLTQLDCQDNRVASLAGVTSLARLVELYAANNALADVKEAEWLVALPSLAVLDLSGTPLATTTEGYRLLVLFRLPRLKVLDGAPAGAAEVAAAHAQHAGRLTMNQLEARCGGGSSLLSSLQALDLSGMGLTNLGDVFGANGPLARLTALVLDNNHVRSLAPLAALTRLLTLSLNANRLGEAEQGSISFAGTAAAAVTEGNNCSVAATEPAPAALLLPSLQVLHMAGNGLTALAPLQLGCLLALRSLFVQDNELTTLDGLEGLTQLRELVADRNKLRVLEADALSSVVRLRELRLGDNRLKGIALPACFAKCSSVGEALAACLPSLAVLHLGGNRLPDAHDCVDKLCGLACLRELSLLNNPLARKQVHRTLLISRCSQLQCIDGQAVTQEERECVQAMASLASPRRCSVELLPGCVGDAAAMVLAAAADATAAAAAAGGSSAAGHAGASRAVGSSPKAAAAMGHHHGMPPVLNYEALAHALAARHGLLGGGALFPGVSVPSIQSSVLMLTGAASFGLEGTAIGGGASARAGGASKQQQGSPTRCGAKQASGRRVTTGSIPPGAIVSSRAGGFTVRQAMFH